MCETTEFLHRFAKEFQKKPELHTRRASIRRWGQDHEIPGVAAIHRFADSLDNTAMKTTKRSAMGKVDDMARQHDNRRQWTRFPIWPRRDVQVRCANGEMLAGTLYDESYGGACIAFPESVAAATLTVGATIPVVDQGVEMVGTIRHRRIEKPLGLIVGVEWKTSRASDSD